MAHVTEGEPLRIHSYMYLGLGTLHELTDEDSIDFSFRFTN